MFKHLYMVYVCNKLMFNKERYTAYIDTKSDSEILLYKVKNEARMIKTLTDCGDISNSEFSAYKRYIKKHGYQYRQLINLLKSKYPRNYNGIMV